MPIRKEKKVFELQALTTLVATDPVSTEYTDTLKFASGELPYFERETVAQWHMLITCGARRGRTSGTYRAYGYWEGTIVVGRRLSGPLEVSGALAPSAVSLGFSSSQTVEIVSVADGGSGELEITVKTTMDFQEDKDIIWSATVTENKVPVFMGS